MNRFIQEAQAASALIIRILLPFMGSITLKTHIILPLNLSKAKTLRDLSPGKNSLPLNQILKIGIQIAEALSGTSGGNRSPRYQARKHNGPQRWLCEGSGFRFGKTDRKGKRKMTSRSKAKPQALSKPIPVDHGNGRLYVARTSPRKRN